MDTCDSLQVLSAPDSKTAVLKKTQIDWQLNQPYS